MSGGGMSCATGGESRYAGYYDIDWEPADPQLRGKVLLPVLSGEYYEVLARHELQVRAREGEFLLDYSNRCFPLAPDSIEGWIGKGSPDASKEEARAKHELAKLNADVVALDRLLHEQHYLLVSWRQADSRLNYRRFFNVPDLAGLREEDEKVFEAAHQLIRRWTQNGWIDGLRVDHPDGLYDPGQYLERLRQLAPKAWIVAEKILLSGESIPDSWPISGTTGYDFLNEVAALFVDPKGEMPFTHSYVAFTGETPDYTAVVIEKKRHVLNTMFTAEVKRLTWLLAQIASEHEKSKSFIPDELSAVIVEWAAALPVYRTYVQSATGANEADIARIERTTEAAKKQRPGISPVLFDLVRDVLLLRMRGDKESQFVGAFQQLTGPAMAKGMEDTACYCFNRLIALNEVGGDPGTFGQDTGRFHEKCRQRLESWPDSMLTTSTHDTKRSEDVRARICLLSEIPERWFATVQAWSAMTERYRHQGQPDRNMEYFYYQTLVGAWPITAERVLPYMEKAACESQQFTAWNHRNPGYDRALRHYVAASLEDTEFTRAVAEFVASLEEAGKVNSLAQTLIKLTAPGVPDIYQGCESWDWSLVDPDNRRPVDFEYRGRLLSEADKFSAQEVWQRRETGLPKLWMIRRTLAFRRQHPDVFGASAGYQPLQGRGSEAEHVVGFMRGHAAIVVAPRLVLRLNGNWGDTVLELPDGDWWNKLTEEGVMIKPTTVASLLRNFPVALLVRKERRNA